MVVSAHKNFEIQPRDGKFKLLSLHVFAASLWVFIVTGYQVGLQLSRISFKASNFKWKQGQ